jgi:tetratricopeptide (TPR) repeat protein
MVLHQCAVRAMNQNLPQEAMRLMGRVFLEGALEDVRSIGNMLVQGWLNGLWVDQAQKNVLKAILDEAIDAAAREEFERAFQLAMNANDMLENAGEPPIPGVLLMAGLRAAANALVEQARDPVPAPARTVDDLLNEADRLLERDPEGALGCYTQAARQAPEDPGGWVGAAGLLWALKHHADAIPHYDRAVALAPGVASLWYERADCLESVDRLEEALASYDRALELEPQMVNAWVDRAHVLNRLKRSKEAMASLQHGLKIHPDHAVGWFNLAEQQQGQGFPAEAAESYARFLSLIHPHELPAQQQRARAQRALILHRLGRFEETLATLSDLGPLDAHLSWVRATCLLAQGRVEEAYEVLAPLPDEVSDVWIERGLCLERLKRVPEALEAFDKAHVMSGRRWVHEARLRPEQAPDFYGRAVECLLAEERTSGLDRLRTVELAFARKKLAELDPAQLAELEAFNAERRATTAGSKNAES